jgi:hypothetical protein
MPRPAQTNAWNYSIYIARGRKNTPSLQFVTPDGCMRPAEAEIERHERLAGAQKMLNQL